MNHTLIFCLLLIILFFNKISNGFEESCIKSIQNIRPTLIEFNNHVQYFKMNLSIIALSTIINEIPSIAVECKLNDPIFNGLKSIKEPNALSCWGGLRAIMKFSYPLLNDEDFKAFGLEFMDSLFYMLPQALQDCNLTTHFIDNLKKYANATKEFNQSDIDYLKNLNVVDGKIKTSLPSINKFNDFDILGEENLSEFYDLIEGSILDEEELKSKEEKKNSSLLLLIDNEDEEDEFMETESMVIRIRLKLDDDEEEEVEEGEDKYYLNSDLEGDDTIIGFRMLQEDNSDEKIKRQISLPLPIKNFSFIKKSLNLSMDFKDIEKLIARNKLKCLKFFKEAKDNFMHINMKKTLKIIDHIITDEFNNSSIQNFTKNNMSYKNNTYMNESIPGIELNNTDNSNASKQNMSLTGMNRTKNSSISEQSAMLISINNINGSTIAEEKIDLNNLTKPNKNFRSSIFSSYLPMPEKILETLAILDIAQPQIQTDFANQKQEYDKESSSMRQLDSILFL